MGIGSILTSFLIEIGVFDYLTNFIKNHILLSQKDTIVTGRRVNLGPKYSTMLRDGTITSQWLESHFLQEFLKIKDDAKQERHSEEGFSIELNGLIHYFLKKRKKTIPKKKESVTK